MLGNRPDRFEKAAHCGADAVVLDLEDSVPSVDKAGARVAIARDWTRLQGLGVPLVVRINTADSQVGQADLAWLAALPLPAAVMVPKAVSLSVLEQVHRKRLATAP